MENLNIKFVLNFVKLKNVYETESFYANVKFEIFISEEKYYDGIFFVRFV